MMSSSSAGCKGAKGIEWGEETEIVMWHIYANKNGIISCETIYLTFYLGGKNFDVI